LAPNYNSNYYIVMGGMMAADIASYSVSTKYQSRSVRDLDAHPAVKFFFSYMQFNGNAGMLYGLRRCTLPFLIIFVTQTTPFVATLRRKQIFTSNMGGAMVYGGFLLYSAIYVQLDYIQDGNKTFAIVRGLGQIAALQRMTPLPSSIQYYCGWIQNKYVVWTTAFLILRYVREHMDDFSELLLKAIWGTTFVLCLFLGYYKSMMGLKKSTNITKIKSV
jgi:hypothetical protein